MIGFEYVCLDFNIVAFWVLPTMISVSCFFTIFFTLSIQVFNAYEVVTQTWFIDDVNDLFSFYSTSFVLNIGSWLKELYMEILLFGKINLVDK